ncbi:pentatricopeptide repeat-containing protein DOT4, chloroplastic-like [Elaeis guineensis]|uniref:Pentatricopeptide repeat-containing protein DOT4, chloroplastic-like n=1 Tax=Elaeis guineensis var. tenera TaxID=51953 RepID=A0A6J0PG08_ELAGV|nr:pentatricopeptide repeat-containing protein DOT4, chloroplastic-like [Elaeis guineensis]XP_019705044.1 pentatricopeptide repeat-containing protein DOT4, chloroplastic-like [Elaeis guineensis]XP_029119191.1 pentatricopeptide repeat-containing protein DOT4, chloroplastic-like [Elaeis guineensis]XP_029119193.1 pentatricopeptide repeat-containing protein DOT4, chloroplastic-like [Elaeis guineensis]
MQSHLQYLTKPLPLQTWNRMIWASTRNGSYLETLHLYSSMLRSGVHGDGFTFPFVAKACAKLRSVRDGRKLHGHALLMGFQGNPFVQTSLMDMYSKCYNLSDARQLFDEMPSRGLVAWNSMISAYSQDFQINKSFKLLNELRALGLRPTSSTCVSLVSGCAGSVAALMHGLSVHCYGIKVGFHSDLRFSNSILSMYAWFGHVDDACSLFDSMEEKSIITWTAMAGGFLRVGDSMNVFDLFNQMRGANINPDSAAFINLIYAGILTGKSSIACAIHSVLISSGFDQKVDIAPLLLTLYSKCGELTSAREVFDSMLDKDVILWTSMISGYVQGGLSSEALVLSEELLSSNVKPNKVTILTVLSACADSGSLNFGEKIGEYVMENELQSDLRVQTALIYMYCKCGNIERAKDIFDGVSAKDITMWSTMIKGYACHGKGKEALALFEEMQREETVKPDAILFTEVLLACTHSGLVEEGLQCFINMQKDYGVDPSIEHYLCIVDLLARAGHFGSALRFINNMPIQARNQMLSPLLSACRTHHDNQFGELVSEQLIRLKPQNTGNYVLMSNVYASLGKWKEVIGLRNSINRRGLIKEPGWSRIELNS